MVAQALDATTQEAEMDLCKFEASMVYNSEFQDSQATYRDPVSTTTKQSNP